MKYFRLGPVFMVAILFLNPKIVCSAARNEVLAETQSLALKMSGIVPGIEKGYIYWDGYKNDASVNSTKFFSVGNTNYFLVGGSLPTSFIKVLSYNPSTRQFKLDYEIKTQGDLTNYPQRIESISTLDVGDAMPTIFFVSRFIVGSSNKGVFAARLTGGQYVPTKLPGSEKAGVTFISVHAFSAGGTNFVVATCDASPDNTAAMLWSVSGDTYTLVDSLSGGPVTLYTPPVGASALLPGKPVLLSVTASDPILFAKTSAGMTATTITNGKFGAPQILPTPTGAELTNIASFVDNNTVKGLVTSRQGGFYSWQTGENSLTKFQDITSVTSLDFGDFSGDGKIDIIGGFHGITGKMMLMTGNGSTFTNLADNLKIPGDNAKDPLFVKLSEGLIGFYVTVKSSDGTMNQVAVGVLGPDTQPLAAVPVVNPNLVSIPGVSVRKPLDYSPDRFTRSVNWNSRTLAVREEGVYKVRIFTASGRVAFSHCSKGNTKYSLSQSSLGKPGVYLVSVSTTRETYSGKIVVNTSFD